MNRYVFVVTIDEGSSEYWDEIRNRPVEAGLVTLSNDVLFTLEETFGGEIEIKLKALYNLAYR